MLAQRRGALAAALAALLAAACYASPASASRVGAGFVAHSTFSRTGVSREGALVGYSETAGVSGTSEEDASSSDDASALPPWCKDRDDRCASWAASGECDANPGFMRSTCKRSCGACVRAPRKTRARDGPRVFLDVKIGDDLPGGGRVVLDLFASTHPRTAENFRQLCVGAPGFGYKGATFHRIIPGFMNQAGATRGGSIYGGQFEDESFVHAHDEPFLLSMANSGPDTNADQFFITVDPQPHLDGKHQVFGTVVEGEDVVMAVNEVGTGGFAGTPKERVVIVDAGEIP